MATVDAVFRRLRDQALARASARSSFLVSAKTQYVSLSQKQANDLQGQATRPWTVAQAKVWIRGRAAARLHIMDSIYQKFRALTLTTGQTQVLERTKGRYLSMIRSQAAAWGRVATRQQALALAHAQERERSSVMSGVYNNLLSLTNAPNPSVTMSQATAWVKSQALLNPVVAKPAVINLKPVPRPVVSAPVPVTVAPTAVPVPARPAVINLKPVPRPVVSAPVPVTVAPTAVPVLATSKSSITSVVAAAGAGYAIGGITGAAIGGMAAITMGK